MWGGRLGGRIEGPLDLRFLVKGLKSISHCEACATMLRCVSCAPIFSCAEGEGLPLGMPVVPEEKQRKRTRFERTWRSVIRSIGGLSFQMRFVPSVNLNSCFPSADDMTAIGNCFNTDFATPSFAVSKIGGEQIKSLGEQLAICFAISKLDACGGIVLITP